MQAWDPEESDREKPTGKTFLIRESGAFASVSPLVKGRTVISYKYEGSLITAPWRGSDSPDLPGKSE